MSISPFAKFALLFILAFVSLTADAQFKGRDFSFGPDTLITSSSVDTVKNWIGGTSLATAYKFDTQGSIVIQAETDYLSGTAAATLKVQFSGDGTTWYDAASLTITGTANQTVRIEDTDFSEVYVRILTFAASSTQSVKLWGYVVFKKRPS
jgi:hypothetical protein